MTGNKNIFLFPHQIELFVIIFVKKIKNKNLNFWMKSPIDWISRLSLQFIEFYGRRKGFHRLQLFIETILLPPIQTLEKCCLC